MWNGLGGCVHPSLPGAQLDDSLSFSKNFNLREQLMIDLHYCLVRVLRCHDGRRLVLARDRPWSAVHPNVIIGRSPSGQVIRRKELIDRIRQKCCRRDRWCSCAPLSSLCEAIFVEVFNIGWGETLSKDSENLNEGTKCCG